MYSLIAAVLIMSGGVISATPSQKPVIKAPLRADFDGRVSDLDSLTRTADAICVVRVKKKSDAAVNRRPKTLYSMEIVDVIKDHHAVSDTLTVARGIGRVEYPDKILDFSDDMPDWEPGESLLLFLTWDEPSKAYWSVHGAVGAARVDQHGRILPLKKSSPLRALEGLPVRQIQDYIRPGR